MADAAIVIIGERGLRALTHRAVDQALALPDGSTSYYLRTRRALLERVVTRLAERTEGDMRASATPAAPAPAADRPAIADRGPDLPERLDALPERLDALPERLDALPERLDALSERAGVLLDRMIGARRLDSMVRYALTIELATDPGLHRVLTAGQPVRDMAIEALTRLGAPDPTAQALDLVSMTDGLVFDRLVGTRSLLGPAPGTAASVTGLARAVRTYLRGVFGC